MPGGHVEGRRAAAIDGRRAVSARKDLGLRPDQRLGVGRLQRRVRHRRRRANRRRPSPSRSRTFRTSASCSFDGDKGQIYFRLFSYARYLNQRNLDESYVDAFGNTKTVQRRQDIQLQKFFAPFSGWFLTPKMRYYLYVWSSNASQGDPAQVVGAGNLTWTFNRFVSVGAGITSLPSVRSTEGQFPYWLGVDNRLIADEFFRGSYTSGVWLKGEFHTKVKYQAMFGNNLSTLGVSAAQLDNKLDTQSYSVAWLPTTGEFGLWNTFGDYDDHQKVATRIGLHYTHSLEEKQSQPGTEGIENSQIRLTDGSVIFTPDLFGPGITVNEVDYRMSSVDAGVKYQGLSLEGEYYWRWLSNSPASTRAAFPTSTTTAISCRRRRWPFPRFFSCTSAPRRCSAASATSGKCEAARTGT